MDDMDEARAATGTAADFSNWNINNPYGTAKKKNIVKVREEVIEPPNEDEAKPETIEKKEMPKAANVKNLEEVKKLAERLLPTVDKVKPQEFQLASELAIDLAIVFETTWQNRIRS
jgi:hypothetical protein